MTNPLKDIRLDDKFAQLTEPVLVNGNQALVRALLLQRKSARRTKLQTAGYVSGYRGSPMGGLDQTLWEQQAHLSAADIVFEPGINEDLAATAVWGMQQLVVMGERRRRLLALVRQGAGRGPLGGDPLKHGNYSGRLALPGCPA